MHDALRSGLRWAFTSLLHSPIIPSSFALQIWVIPSSSPQHSSFPRKKYDNMWPPYLFAWDDSLKRKQNGQFLISMTSIFGTLETIMTSIFYQIGLVKLNLALLFLWFFVKWLGLSYLLACNDTNCCFNHKTLIDVIRTMKPQDVENKKKNHSKWNSFCGWVFLGRWSFLFDAALQDRSKKRQIPFFINIWLKETTESLVRDWNGLSVSFEASTKFVPLRISFTRFLR